MSHYITVGMVADQEIEIQNKVVNIHDIKTIEVDAYGKIIDAYIPSKLKWLVGIKEGK